MFGRMDGRWWRNGPEGVRRMKERRGKKEREKKKLSDQFKRKVRFPRVCENGLIWSAAPSAKRYEKGTEIKKK